MEEKDNIPQFVNSDSCANFYKLCECYLFHYS